MRVMTELLLAIDHRGGDACGYVAVREDGSMIVQRASTDAFGFLRGCRLLPADVRTLLVHTRLATQGHPAFPENNHPVESGGVYVVHNGHIANDRALFRDTGAYRAGDVDSEAIPMMLAHKGMAAYAEALEALEGSFAIAAVWEQSPGLLMLAKGEWSPLAYVQSERLAMFASEGSAISRAWGNCIGTPPKQTRYLQAGDVVIFDDAEVARRGFTPKRQKVYSVQTAAATGFDFDYRAWKARESTKALAPAAKPLSLVDSIEDDEDEDGAFLADAESAGGRLSPKLEHALSVLEARVKAREGLVCTPVGLRDAREDDMPDEFAELAQIACGGCGEFNVYADMEEWRGDLYCCACLEAAAVLG
jgi:hypothetical protein